MIYKNITTRVRSVFIAGSFLISTLYTAQVGQTFTDQSLLGQPSAEQVLMNASEQVNLTIDKMKNDPVLRYAEWGYAVYDPTTKKMIASYNENSPLVPASTTKLLTTDTVYSLLGSNFRFDTQLEYSGEISEDGVLQGDLFLIGSGDPSLGINHAGAPSYWSMVESFRDVIRNAGIRKIEGKLIIQTAIFNNDNLFLPPNILWKKKNNYFLPVGATNGIDPEKERSVRNTHSLDKDDVYYYQSPYTGELAYTKEFNGNTTLNGTLPLAPSYFAKLLRTSLVKNGISIGAIDTRMIDDAQEARTLLTDYKSPKLEDIIYFTNQTSNNRLAEEFLKLAGFYTFGDLSLRSAKLAVSKHLEEVNFDFTGFTYIDGSGLSHSHRVTPIAQVKFLAGLMKRPYYDSFYQTLPIAGTTGTLKRMFVNNYETGKIVAKTGTLNRVKTLAGYINTTTGKRLTFSILIKNYNGSVAQVKRKMEELLEPTIDL